MASRWPRVLVPPEGLQKMSSAVCPRLQVVLPGSRRIAGWVKTRLMHWPGRLGMPPLRRAFTDGNCGLRRVATADACVRSKSETKSRTKPMPVRRESSCCSACKERAASVHLGLMDSPAISHAPHTSPAPREHAPAQQSIWSDSNRKSLRCHFVFAGHPSSSVLPRQRPKSAASILVVVSVFTFVSCFSINTSGSGSSSRFVFVRAVSWPRPVLPAPACMSLLSAVGACESACDRLLVCVKTVKLAPSDSPKIFAQTGPSKSGIPNSAQWRHPKKVSKGQRFNAHNFSVAPSR